MIGYILLKRYTSSRYNSTVQMADSLSAQDKLALIYENLHEKLKEEIIEDVIIRQNRSLKIYWGSGYRMLKSTVC